MPDSRVKSSRNRSGRTAHALIDAAEAAFASEGFDGASLRAVMRTAGTDPGAIHYHFGGREELAAEVLNRILAPLNQRRLQLLEQAEQRAGDGPIQLGALMEAIVRPDLEAAFDLDRRGRGRAQLIGAIYIRPSTFVTAQVEAHFAPVATRFMPHMVRQLPDLPPEVMAWRVRWAVFGMVGAILSDGPVLAADQGPQGEPDDSGNPPSGLGLEQLTARIVAAGAAAVAAPVETP